MTTINEWKDVTLESFKSMGEKIGNTIPKLIGVFFVLLIGWIITKLLLVLLKKILLLIKIDSFGEKFNELDILEGNQIQVNISEVLLGFAKWAIYLIFLTVAADIMDWNIVSTEIGNLLRYLPKLFSGIILFIFGIYIATLIKKAISTLFGSMGLNGAKFIGTIIFYLVAVFFTISALNQVGVDTTIITNNVTMIMGAFLLALALGFGFGSREVINILLLTFYTRKKYAIGDLVEIDGLEGKIESLDNLSVTLQINDESVVLPIRELAYKRIKIKRRFVS
ncbi:hypothetical protein D1013_09780 [Euzebyella marina]|uniref:Mechanosensitive ion channel MscS domain-containing protein n=1 Tax=Euzebyella marina TaxID=1761453 RepID=A0A3G2L5T9_9FLAO|nr:mechanosensitive ion channel domain-containing protein [Euzebyella marina]AYN67634.1 hypothetical protein D1013_09780 [Euzebyella marina]